MFQLWTSMYLMIMLVLPELQLPLNFDHLDYFPFCIPIAWRYHNHVGWMIMSDFLYPSHQIKTDDTLITCSLFMYVSEFCCCSSFSLVVAHFPAGKAVVRFRCSAYFLSSVFTNMSLRGSHTSRTPFYRLPGFRRLLSASASRRAAGLFFGWAASSRLTAAWCRPPSWHTAGSDTCAERVNGDALLMPFGNWRILDRWWEFRPFFSDSNHVAQPAKRTLRTLLIRLSQEVLFSLLSGRTLWPRGGSIMLWGRLSSAAQHISFVCAWNCTDMRFMLFLYYGKNFLWTFLFVVAALHTVSVVLNGLLLYWLI